MLRRWFKRFLINQVIGFIFDYLTNLSGNIDWDKLRTDVEAHVRRLVPGTIFDDIAVRWAMSLIDMFESVLGASDTLKEILDLLAAQKWQEAWQKLRDLILDNVTPTNTVEQFVYDCVDDCRYIA